MLAWAADIASAEEQRFLTPHELTKLDVYLLRKLRGSGMAPKDEMVKALEGKATIAHLRQLAPQNPLLPQLAFHTFSTS